MQTIKTFCSDAIFNDVKFNKQNVCAAYWELLSRLHAHAGGLDSMSHTQSYPVGFPYRFSTILSNLNTAIMFVVVHGKIVATAQGSFVEVFPINHVYINNVITLRAYEGKGYGKLAMEALEKVAVTKWGGPHRRLRFFLTNSPNKGNGGFYERLGYTARSAETNNPTVVWTKDV